MADLTTVCPADAATQFDSEQHCARSVYDEDYYPVLISAMPPTPVRNVTGCPPVDLLLEGSSPTSLLSIPIWLLRDVFLHLDVNTRSRLMRVNRSWKCELETLQVDQKAQFVDFTEYLRAFIYWKLGGPQFLGQEDSSVIRWLATNPDKLYSQCAALQEKIRAVSGMYSTLQNGTLVVKLNTDFEYCVNCATPTRTVNHTLDLVDCLFGLLFFEARHLIFVDSVICQRDPQHWWIECFTVHWFAALSTQQFFASIWFNHCTLSDTLSSQIQIEPKQFGQTCWTHMAK